MDNKTIKVYTCGVDWQHELGHAAGGNRVYASVKDLKEHAKCWEQCGIVELEITLSKWIAEQDFTKVGE